MELDHYLIMIKKSIFFNIFNDIIFIRKYFDLSLLSLLLNINICIYYIFSAIDLIANLLQVKQRKRFTVDKSLVHVWLQVNIYFCLFKTTILDPYKLM